VKDPYAVLGVPRNASDAQIRYAYRQAIRSTEAGGSVEVKERLDELEEAYKVLSDPRKRRAYDGHPVSTLPEAEPASAPPLPVLREAEKPPRNPFTRLTHKLPRPWRIAIDWVLTIAGAVLIVLAIKAWVVNPYRIPSSSMEPTLHCARPGSGCEARFSDRVLANRFIYHFRSPHRGEIVVFNTPPKAKQACGEGGTFVKRLIGVPGDKVRERDGWFYINGKRYDDSSYIKPERRDDRSGFWVVPPDHYFFVGDNRTQSCDSRRWGSVPRGNLIGPVFAIYWPPNRIHVDTPGLVGAIILAVIGGILAVFVVLAIRRRRVR
jgi:signal peptidase I